MAKKISGEWELRNDEKGEKKKRKDGICCVPLPFVISCVILFPRCSR